MLSHERTDVDGPVPLWWTAYVIAIGALLMAAPFLFNLYAARMLAETGTLWGCGGHGSWNWAMLTAFLSAAFFCLLAATTEKYIPPPSWPRHKLFWSFLLAVFLLGALGLLYGQFPSWTSVPYAWLGKGFAYFAWAMAIVGVARMARRLGLAAFLGSSEVRSGPQTADGQSLDSEHA